jgi:O-antigen ligase/tetratricopeptide (TPR) repeat protein
LTAYFAVILASCFISVDFNLSFWGDIERMLGFFHLVHFLIFYFILITVMREWKDWRLVFITSLAVTLIVSVKAIAGSPESTIGNRAYVAGLLIFNIYFAFLLFYRDRDIKVPVPHLNWLYLLPIPFFLWAFKEQNIIGAEFGLVAGIISFVFLFGILDKKKIIRRATWGLVLVAALASAGIWITQGEQIKSFFANEDTFQTRLIAWQGAWEKLGEHPILGTGYGTFAETFDKTFDADFYNYVMRGATYFDRAHNNMVDIASTTGLLGAFTYLFVMVALVYYLILAYRRGRIGRAEFALLVALLAAYFVQNLAVFDSLVTYVSLMALAGFIYWFSFNSDSGTSRELIAETGDKKLSDKEIFTLAGVGVVVLIILFQFNIQTWQMLDRTIQAQVLLARGDALSATEYQKRAMDYNTPLDRDSRSAFVKSILSNARALSNLPVQERNDLLDYCIKLVEKNVQLDPGDTKIRLQSARINYLAARFNAGDQDLSEKYIDKAFNAVNKAIQSSPERIPIYLFKAQLFLEQENREKAIETFKYASSLNDNYYDVHCYLARVYLEDKKDEKGYQRLEKCIDKGGVNSIDSEFVVKKGINHYLEAEDEEMLLKMYERLAKLEKDNGDTWMKLAQLYASQGKIEEAKQAARQAGQADESVSSQATEFIEQLEEGDQYQFVPPGKIKN